MVIYFFSALFAVVIAALVFAENGHFSLLLWLPLLGALAWLAFLRGKLGLGAAGASASALVGAEGTGSTDALADFAQHARQPALLVKGGCISNVNRAVLKALCLEGRSDDLIGMPLDNIVHPKHHARLAAILANELASCDLGVITLLRADGMPWVVQARLFRGHDSGASLLHFSALDAQPGENSDTLRSNRLVNSAGEVLFALDSQLLVTYLNPHWENLSRHSRAATLFSPFISLFPTEDRALLAKGLRQLQSGERNLLELELRLPQSRGSGQRWVEVRAWPLQLAMEGEAGIAGLMLDISQRKQNDEVLRAQRRSLRTMLDNLPGMIYRGQNDRDWTIEFASEGCYELTGYTPLELVANRSTCLAELIHPEDREYVWNFVQTRLARRERFELSYRIVDREGTVHWVWEQGRGIYSSKGEFLGLEGYITEVSSRGAQEEARRRLFFDNATGIVSLSIFLERLSHLIVHAPLVGYPFVLVHLGLESLDEVTARHGAAMVERLLVETGKRLRVVLSDCNVVARYGDAGFVVLISDFRPATLHWAAPEGGPPPAADQPAAQENALRALLARPFRIEGQVLQLRVTARAITRIEPHADAQALLAEAAAGNVENAAA
jgi:PAS domain S-box-containing protein